jgi:hypothetical protein
MARSVRSEHGQGAACALNLLVSDSWRPYYGVSAPDAGGCEPPVAAPMAGATAGVVVVEADEVAACVAGRAFGGRVVAGVAVVGGVVGTNVDAAGSDVGGRDVGGIVVFVSCPEGFVTTSGRVPEHPALTRAMTTPTPAMTDVRLMRCTRRAHPSCRGSPR